MAGGDWQIRRDRIRARAVRGLGLTVIGIATLTGTATGATARTDPDADNPVVVENRHPGTDAWRIHDASRDTPGRIKGFASRTSVDIGETIDFNVTVWPAQTFTLDIFRMGWYQGLGGRHMRRIGPLAGTTQDSCLTRRRTGLIECRWSVAHRLRVPRDWTSGMYLGLLKNRQGYMNYIPFTVRDDDRRADILVQSSMNTWQAYNAYPRGSGGKSLYGGEGARTLTGTRRAVQVSYDRPYDKSGQKFHSYEIHYVRWLERSGYDVVYSTNVDTHERGHELLEHRAFISIGKDEYWSMQMRRNVERAVAAGVHVAFFGGCDMFWQIRFKPSSDGVPNRVIVGYKQWAHLDPYASSSDPAKRQLTTTNFRRSPVDLPEQMIVGTMFKRSLWDVRNNLDYVVTNSGHWIYQGTGLSNGDRIRRIIGHEYHSVYPAVRKPRSTSFTVLSRSPDPAGGSGHVTIYRAPSGAFVFSASTLVWGWGLDRHKGWERLVDGRLMRITANLLDRFIAGPFPHLDSSGSGRSPGPMRT